MATDSDAVRKQMQIDVAVVGGGTRENRSHQARLKLVEHPHGVEGDAALLLQRVVVRIASKQALMRPQRGFNLDVFRQHGNVVDTQAVGGLALRLKESPRCRVRP